jgi:hypothetical protein
VLVVYCNFILLHLTSNSSTLVMPTVHIILYVRYVLFTLYLIEKISGGCLVDATSAAHSSSQPSHNTRKSGSGLL